ncbi:DMT family transporter [Ktedonobacter robiniae]|uniref:Membrane protein n=1 Tax=Ktedonobacter robiniae TaxID=2778365 RepID=A0ABQ3UZQ8_9CHLR|nr:DMT family transporter [Ktedonobacter robiniae]GHO58371.1 membrane protein [Ktedonobacter robiniae]
MTRKGWLLFTAMSVIWGIPYLFIKIAVRELDPIVVVFARVGVAALVLFPVAVHQGVLRQLRERWLTVAALACVQIAGPFLLISYGEQHIASSLTSLLIAADPLLVVLFALRFDPSERVRGTRLLGLLIGLGGVVTLLGLDAGGDTQRLLGATLVLLAATGYAVGALLIKRPTIATLPSLGVVTVECTTATVVLAPLAVTRLPGRIPDLEVIVSLLVLGLICTALAYLLFFALVTEVGASRGSVITYVNPAVSVLLGVTLLAEPLNAAIIAGFLLIIVGSWLSTGGVLPPPVKHLLRTTRREPISRDTEVSKLAAPPRK